jgi:hypothetical protein
MKITQIMCPSALLLALAMPQQPASQPQEHTTRTRVVLLGTGTPDPILIVPARRRPLLLMIALISSISDRASCAALRLQPSKEKFRQSNLAISKWHS